MIYGIPVTASFLPLVILWRQQSLFLYRQSYLIKEWPFEKQNEDIFHKMYLYINCNHEKYQFCTPKLPLMMRYSTFKIKKYIYHE